STRDHLLPNTSTTFPDSIVIGVLAEGTSASVLTHTMPSPWAERLDYASSSSIGRVGMLAVYTSARATSGAVSGTVTSSTSGHSATMAVVLAGEGGGSTPGGGTAIDTDDELNWVAPTVPGDYVIRYEVDAAEGTFSDDLVVTVSDAPTGPQTLYPDSIESRARVGEPTVTTELPDNAIPTQLGINTDLGDFYLGYRPYTGPQPQTVYPDPLPSRAIV